MTAYTRQTAPTQFVEANGIRFAYRRFGKSGGVPLVFNQHLTGTMDHWDPAVTDGLARDRDVILFNNAGVSSSSGEVPTTVQVMGADAVAFITALGLPKVDVLGFSIGGFIAQEIVLQAPDLVRRLVLVGTGPRSGEGFAARFPVRPVINVLQRYVQTSIETRGSGDPICMVPTDFEAVPLIQRHMAGLLASI